MFFAALIFIFLFDFVYFEAMSLSVTIYSQLQPFPRFITCNLALSFSIISWTNMYMYRRKLTRERA